MHDRITLYTAKVRASLVFVRGPDVPNIGSIDLPLRAAGESAHTYRCDCIRTDPNTRPRLPCTKPRPITSSRRSTSRTSPSGTHRGSTPPARCVALVHARIYARPDAPLPSLSFPAPQVPAIAYGGPETAPDDPSPQSTKLAESLILVEFVADLFPAAGLLPADPVARAQARFFIDAVGTKFTPAWFAYLQGKGTLDALYDAVGVLQGLLPATGYAVGAYSVADIAITPFLARARVALLNDLGAYPEGEGKKVIQTLTSGEGKFARFGKYFNDLLARESFKATFDEVRTFLDVRTSCD